MSQAERGTKRAKDQERTKTNDVLDTFSGKTCGKYRLQRLVLLMISCQKVLVCNMTVKSKMTCVDFYFCTVSMTYMTCPSSLVWWKGFKHTLKINHACDTNDVFLDKNVSLTKF